jgi:hypothetical protein
MTESPVLLGLKRFKVMMGDDIFAAVSMIGIGKIAKIVSMGVWQVLDVFRQCFDSSAANKCRF